MKHKMISRVAFCNACYQKGNPQDGQMYIVHGSTSNKIHFGIYEAPLKRADCAYTGFVPHLFTVDQLLPSGRLQVRMTCCMEGCQTQIAYNTNGKLEYWITGEKYIIMTTKEWEALENFNDSGYRL